MAQNSAIEWTDATWNPVTGCTEVSPGCDHCYAKVFAERFRGAPNHPYEQGFDLKLWPERLARGELKTKQIEVLSKGEAAQLINHYQAMQTLDLRGGQVAEVNV